MRYLLIAVIALASCQNTKPIQQQADTTRSQVVYVHDTIHIPAIQCNTDSLRTALDSVARDNHILATRLLTARLTIGHAKYYLAIVNRNPSQIKFVKGWWNRVFQYDTNPVIKPEFDK